MRIIPVIDIKNGLAVHARGGHRDDYQPLVTRFAETSLPEDIIDGMVRELAVRQIYIADLDALMTGRCNAALIERLALANPTTTIMVDCGLTDTDVSPPMLNHHNIDLIVASESLSSVETYSAVIALIPPERRVLSLDRRGAERMGPVALFEQPELWPERIIHMNLAAVGGDAGPDWDGLADLRARHPNGLLYAAGGVRHLEDLRRLAELGTAAVLVGSALHDGRLDIARLAEFTAAA
jgi:phosphoribosylformimino-5-aminoimidazole carboxamide ribotide isomerase